MFSVLSEANKVERRAEKLKLLEEKKALEEPVKPEPVIDEVKGRSWADVDSDDETPHAGGGVGIPDSSSDEGEPEEEGEENGVAETESVVSEAAKSNEPTKPEAAAPKQLSKKEKAALKKQELDDLDDVLAEFGVEVSAPAQEESKKKKKKSKDEASKNNTPELSEVEKVSASPEPSEPAASVDENIKEEALKKLAGKGKGKGKGGAKSEKKSGISTAAEEAKKRAKNAAKPKKDKNAFDR